MQPPSLGINAEINGFDRLRELVQYKGGIVTDLDRLTKGIQTVYPSLWRRCYTKHYDLPGNYRGAKAVACTFASAYLETEMMLNQKKLISNGWMIARLLEAKDWPCYAVTGPLLQAMLRTHPPQGMTWADIPWPFEAVTFMIPRDLLKDITGASIYALGAFHIPSGANPDDLPDWLKHLGAHNYARSGVFWLFEPAGLMLHDCTFPSTQSLEPDPTWIDKATAEQVEHGNGTADMVCSGDFASQMAGIVANLLLVMQARPELVERGSRTGRKLGNGTPVHSPTFIGRKYAVKTEGPRPAATGHFTELRWVAGHLRNQAYGKGRAEHRLIFIDPFLRYGAGLVREVKDDGSTAKVAQDPPSRD